MARPPRTFHEFVGQRRVIMYLMRLIRGARALGKPCPSLLLAAPSGAGKTTFANAIATEYGSTLHLLNAGEATRTAEVCAHLYDLTYGDVGGVPIELMDRMNLLVCTQWSKDDQLN